MKKDIILLVKEKSGPCLRAIGSFAKDNWGFAVPLLYGCLLLAIYKFVVLSCGINKSFFNPWFQSLPFVLLIYSIAWILPNWLAKLYFSFLILLATVLTGVSSFLLCVFKIPLTPDIYYVLTASSIQESLEFIRIYFNWKVWSLFVFGCTFFALVLYLIWRGPVKRGKVTLAVVAALMIPYLINVIRFSVRGEYEPLYKRNLEFEMAIAFSEYKSDLNRLVSMVMRPKLPRDIKMKYPGKIVGVLVIGESASRNHWGLYGYYRNTTPEMERIRNDILIFDDAAAAFANTCSSCRVMFSTAEYPLQLPLDYTAFSVLKAAGYKIILVSNQFRLGPFDGPVNILYTGLDRKEFLQEKFPGAKDGVVLDTLQKNMTEAEGPVLIIVHLIGSHDNYAERYPQDFDKFGGSNAPSEVGFTEKVRCRILNEYDNSILYTDHILGKIIKMVQEQQCPSCMLYLADHGECPEIAGSRSIYSLFFTCYEVPMIFYGNEQYKKNFPELMKAAAENTEKPYLTDWLNYSILSIAQVTHAEFPAEKDIFSAKFKGRENRQVGAQNMPYRNLRIRKPFFVDKHGMVKHLEKPIGN